VAGLADMGVESHGKYGCRFWAIGRGHSSGAGRRRRALLVLEESVPDYMGTRRDVRL
jgi:hypothetical protein